jgi:hypothetical protein
MRQERSVRTPEARPQGASAARIGIVASALLAGTVLAGLATPIAVLAQPRPPVPSAMPEQAQPSPQFVAAKAAFEALPIAERIAIQQDLIWASDFTATTSGEFGNVTYRALTNFERQNRFEPDGILAPNERALLAQVARRGRDAVRFTLRVDERSGARIGIPESLLTRRSESPQKGSRFQTADKKVTLDTRSHLAAEGPLERLFEEATTSSNPNRKVTYRLIRPPDFFVVAGETPNGKFFIRVASHPQGFRGFNLAYDKALATPWDRLTIAIANSFEAVPGAPVTPPGGTPVAGSPAAPPAMPTPQPTPVATLNAATGLVVAAGRVLTATEGLAGCAAHRIGTRAARIAASDPATGLTLLQVDGQPAGPEVVWSEFPAVGQIVVLAHGDRGDRTRGLVGYPAGILGSDTADALRVMAALQPGAAGGILFDNLGAVIGIVRKPPPTRTQVAGVVLIGGHAVTAGRPAVAWLKRQGLTPKLLPNVDGQYVSTGETVQRVGAAVVPITCGP